MSLNWPSPRYPSEGRCAWLNRMCASDGPSTFFRGHGTNPISQSGRAARSGKWCSFFLVSYYYFLIFSRHNRLNYVFRYPRPPKKYYQNYHRNYSRINSRLRIETLLLGERIRIGPIIAGKNYRLLFESVLHLNKFTNRCYINIWLVMGIAFHGRN